MKKYLTAFSFCLLLAVTAFPAYAADDGALKNAIEGRYRDLKTAIANGNPNIYRENLASGFTSTDLAGKTRSADQIVDAIGRGVPDDSRKEKTTVNSLKQDGGKAVVEQTYDMKTIRAAAKGRRKINYHMVTKSTDTWIKDKDTWKLQKTVTNSGDVWINDKPVAHRVRGEAVEPAAGAADKPADKKKPVPAK